MICGTLYSITEFWQKHWFKYSRLRIKSVNLHLLSNFVWNFKNPTPNPYIMPTPCCSTIGIKLPSNFDFFKTTCNSPSRNSQTSLMHRAAVWLDWQQLQSLKAQQRGSQTSTSVRSACDRLWLGSPHSDAVCLPLHSVAADAAGTGEQWHWLVAGVDSAHSGCRCLYRQQHSAHFVLCPGPETQPQHST